MKHHLVEQKDSRGQPLSLNQRARRPLQMTESLGKATDQEGYFRCIDGL